MAASSGAVRAGGAYVEIFAKDGKFQQAMTRVQNRLKATAAAMRSTGAGLMGIGTAIAAPILGAAQAFANLGSELADMSARTGVATEALSVLKFAAEQTGADMGSVETAVKKMQKAIFSAGQGSKEAADALAMVGLSAADLAGLSPDEQMGKIADGLMAIEDPGTRAAVAMAIFGKSGTAILPMLEGGSAGMSRFAAEAKRLGLVMDADTAAKADALGDAIDKMKAAMMMAFIQIGSAVAPILTSVAEKLATVAAAVGTFIRENQSLVVTALKVATGFAAFGAAVFGIGAVLGTASQAIGIFKSVLTALPALFTPIGLAATTAFAAVAAGVVIARQLSPAFKAETDAIWQAITRLDFATAWQIMNLNFAIALTQMAQKASSILATIRGTFASAGSFIGDKLTEGLDRFMGLFGADVITLQNAWQRLAIYFRAAFDWKFAATGMKAAIKEADAAAKRARERAPTADARAADRANGRQTAADKRQAGMDADAEGWDRTIEELRKDLERAHDKLKDTPKDTAAPAQAGGVGEFTPPDPQDQGRVAAAAAAATGIGQTVGTFSSTGEGLGIGPELNKLEQPAIQTAANTAATVEALKGMARGLDGRPIDLGAKPGQAQQPAAPAADMAADMAALDQAFQKAVERREKLYDELAAAESDGKDTSGIESRLANAKKDSDALFLQREAMKAATAVGTSSGAAAPNKTSAAVTQPAAPSSVAAEVAAPRAPAVAQAARTGTAVADSAGIAQALQTGFASIVTAITAHAKLTEAGNGTLSKIESKLSSAGAVFA